MRPRQARARLSDHLGRRGALLAVAGSLWLAIGLAVPLARPPLVVHLHEMLPIPVRVALWVAPGVVALVTAARGRGARDDLAFALLLAGPLIRAGSFGWSYVVWLFDHSAPGADYLGWATAASWGAAVALLRIAAGWPEAPRRRRREDHLS